MHAGANPNRSDLRDIARRAMIRRGLQPSFSPGAMAESDRVTQAPIEKDPPVRDLRRLLWASIDNDDSRDLDQLSVAESMAGGRVKIRVAIADVDALVKAGTAIDGHAGTNTTSVYTVAEIFPMLPEKLSTDLTSLGEGQDRLAIVVEMAVDAEGRVTACFQEKSGTEGPRISSGMVGENTVRRSSLDHLDRKT
jgi:exoribonuclease-2